MGRKGGLTSQCLRVTSMKDSNKDSVNITGLLITRIIKETGFRIGCMGLENTSGKMAGSTLGTGT